VIEIATDGAILNLTDPTESAYRFVDGGGSDRERRRPTSAELGLDVTIGIVALTVPDDYIVAVSDQMISYADFFPAADQGAMKVLQIADNWYMSFAGDTSAFKRVAIELIRRLKPLNNGMLDRDAVAQMASETYADVLHAEFAARNLLQIGYRNVDEFRKDGRQELGPDVFAEHLQKLAEFDLGVELIVFGYCKGRSRVFQVFNPGRFDMGPVEGYAAVGSGYYMAMGSLRQRPLLRSLEDVIYRLLEAKFSAETAAGVGRCTTLVIINRDGDKREMQASDIEEIRKVWEATRAAPIPTEAFDIISKSRAVKSISDGER
jgi:20S proteasome alpha/beta subunit